MSPESDNDVYGEAGAETEGTCKSCSSDSDDELSTGDENSADAANESNQSYKFEEEL